MAANSQWHNEAQEKRGRADTFRLDSDALWDKLTMDRVAAGEEGAMLLLYDRYSRLVYSVALHVLKQKHEAEDIAQEVFLHVWRNAKSYNIERGGLAGWLAVMTRHRGSIRFAEKIESAALRPTRERMVTPTETRNCPKP